MVNLASTGQRSQIPARAARRPISGRDPCPRSRLVEELTLEGGLEQSIWIGQTMRRLRIRREPRKRIVFTRPGHLHDTLRPYVVGLEVVIGQRPVRSNVVHRSQLKVVR